MRGDERISVAVSPLCFCLPVRVERRLLCHFPLAEIAIVEDLRTARPFYDVLTGDAWLIEPIIASEFELWAATSPCARDVMQSERQTLIAAESDGAAIGYRYGGTDVYVCTVHPLACAEILRAVRAGRQIYDDEYAVIDTNDGLVLVYEEQEEPAVLDAPTCAVLLTAARNVLSSREYLDLTRWNDSRSAALRIAGVRP